ncbi:MAG: hypothetical protein CL609_16965 [Anaerolineaceae bacterium]|nr:hypothetical protein [Anaerolineaceae bacterium]
MVTKQTRSAKGVMLLRLMGCHVPNKLFDWKNIGFGLITKQTRSAKGIMILRNTGRHVPNKSFN